MRRSKKSVMRNFGKSHILVLCGILLAAIMLFVFGPKRSIEGMENNDKTLEFKLFSAEKCPHCIKMKPEWTRFASEYSNKKINDITVKTTLHECGDSISDSTKKLMKEHNIEGFPTIKILKNGVATEYNGAMTYDGFVEYANANAN